MYKGWVNIIKKNVLILSILSLLFILSACGTDYQKELTGTDTWDVASTNGESYTAEFENDTVKFNMFGLLDIGVDYYIDDDIITLIENETEYEFKIEKQKKEYHFIAENEDVKNRFGDLTLSIK